MITQAPDAVCQVHTQLFLPFVLSILAGVFLSLGAHMDLPAEKPADTKDEKQLDAARDPTGGQRYAAARGFC